jgi:DNA modification methylase
MKVDLRPVTSIRPYENNPRINDHAVDAVAASIKEFGFRQPIVVDEEGIIVVGHTRFKAAIQLGMRTVPVHVARGLTPAQINAYRLADNQTATLANWNDELLARELAQLQAQEFDLNLTGFSSDDILRLLAPGTPVGLADPDDIPAPPDQATTQPGDVWVLGRHRLLCGDSARPEDLDRLLAGARVHLVNTDPPYNVRVEPRSNNAIAAGLCSFPADAAQQRKPLNRICRANGLRHHQSFDLARRGGGLRPTGRKLRAKDRPLINDFLNRTEFEGLLRAWFSNLARVLEPGRSFYLAGGYANCANYPPVLEACGLYFSQALIWVKQHAVLTRKDFMGDHEWIFYGWKIGAAHKFFGPNNVSDVWFIKKISPQNMIHLTEKPVELARRAIEYSSKPGEHVLDLFAGSGSTLVAAEQTGRRCFLMELDPLYCDVIVRRWEQFTGHKASRESNLRGMKKARKPARAAK